MTLTFDPLVSKCGHGTPVSWASYLQLFSYLCPSFLDLGTGTGETDGKTDEATDNDQSPPPPPHMGVGQNNSDNGITSNVVYIQ